MNHSVGRSVCRSVAECSKHATYGDWPCFSLSSFSLPQRSLMLFFPPSLAFSEALLCHSYHLPYSLLSFFFSFHHFRLLFLYSHFHHPVLSLLCLSFILLYSPLFRSLMFFYRSTYTAVPFFHASLFSCVLFFLFQSRESCVGAGAKRRAQR